MKPKLRRDHRYLAFALSLLWLSHAVTGLLMIHRLELHDASLPGAATLLDLDALGARITAIQATPGGHAVTQLYATGGTAVRYDLGRLLAFAIGIWLLTMLALGVGTWPVRRGARR